MFHRFQRFQDTEPPNLIGIMNLFMVLIPFLLMGAAFYHIAVIPSSLPTHTPQESDVPTTPKTVTINLVITLDTVKLSASSTSLDEEELGAMSGEWPRRDGNSCAKDTDCDKHWRCAEKQRPDSTPVKICRSYPVDALTQRLKEIKADYPKSNTMIVLPHPALDYDTLVTILDATRDYQIATDPRTGEKLRADLFPVVVFSRFIPASQAPEPVPDGAGGDEAGDDEAGDEAGDEGGDEAGDEAGADEETP